MLQADQQALGLYIEDLLKSYTDHVASVAKALVLEGDTPDLQTLSQRFQESPTLTKPQASLMGTILPLDLTARLD